MKKIQIIFLLCIAFACNKSEDSIIEAPSYKTIKMATGSEKVIQSSNDFGLNIFQKIILDEVVSKNVFISPVSLSLALTMTWNGAKGSTKDSMAYVLSLAATTDSGINSINKQLIEGLTSVDPTVIMTIANSIWYRQDFEVEQNFILVNQDYYNASVNSIDFAAPGAKDIINNWVENKTNGKIKNLIEFIQPQDVMFLIDAIYFKGAWKKAFNSDNTRDGSFLLSDGSEKTVKMMSRKDTIGYFENELFQAAALDYGTGNFNMLIILPKENHAPADIIAEMTPENWQTWISSVSSKEVSLILPKFNFEYEITLNDILKAMGMGIAFSDHADFTGINSSGNLYIDLVKHKTFVEVNEEGTEAAAVTVVGVGVTWAPVEDETKYMNVNRPFLFAIREKSTNSIVFLGRVADPEYGE
jgi:serine protease inhibitor